MRVCRLGQYTSVNRKHQTIPVRNKQIHSRRQGSSTVCNLCIFAQQSIHHNKGNIKKKQRKHSANYQRQIRVWGRRNA
jgi:hypothetical protein